MKKFLTVILSALLALTVFTFVGCSNNGEGSTTKTSQWDYFNEYVNYTLYEYLEEAPLDWSRERITNSYGETQQHCWNFVGNYGDVSIKDMVSHSEFDYYSRLRVSRVESAKANTMTKLSLKIYPDADCVMKFSLSITGDTTPRASTTINAKANTGTELLFEKFAEYTWVENSKSQIIIRLENPNEIGNIKYGFSDLTITLK